MFARRTNRSTGFIAAFVLCLHSVIAVPASCRCFQTIENSRPASSDHASCCKSDFRSPGVACCAGGNCGRAERRSTANSRCGCMCDSQDPDPLKLPEKSENSDTDLRLMTECSPLSVLNSNAAQPSDSILLLTQAARAAPPAAQILLRIWQT